MNEVAAAAHSGSRPAIRLVFVCYAREDGAFVASLAGKLKDRGVPVWLDVWNIAPGSDWDESIDAALHSCSHFLIFLSPTSVKSREVRGELRTALNEEKPVVPVLFQPCDIPRQLKLVQYIDFTSTSVDNRAAVDRVMSALQASEAIRANEVESSTEQHGSPPSLVRGGTVRRRMIVVLIAVVLLTVLLAAKFGLYSAFGTFGRSDEHVLIWKVGSPEEGDIPGVTVPLHLRETAQELGTEIEIATFPAKGFNEKLATAMKARAEPDILAADYDILDVIEKDPASFAGVTRSTPNAFLTVSQSLQSLSRGGWEFLITTSHNFGRRRNLYLET